MTKILCCTCDEHCPFHGEKANGAAENAAALLAVVEKLQEMLTCEDGVLSVTEGRTRDLLCELLADAPAALAKVRGGD